MTAADRFLLASSVALAACTTRVEPPALLPDATGDAAASTDVPAPKPTMVCITEADRFHFADSGTYNFRLVSATIGPMSDASLCIQNPPVPDHECQQVVKETPPAFWTKTVTQDNTLVMFGAEGSNGSGLLQTDCAADNSPRSYVSWHNPSRTAAFTFLVERAEAAP